MGVVVKVVLAIRQRPVAPEPLEEVGDATAPERETEETGPTAPATAPVSDFSSGPGPQSAETALGLEV